MSETTMNAQLQLFEIAPTTKTERARHARQQAKTARTVNETLSQMRALHEQMNALLYNSQERPFINSPADSVELIGDQMAILDHEELFVILLNRRNAVIQIVRLYVGSVNSSQVRVGEVFKPAITQSASAIIVAHNHPSGDPTPSPDDVAVTRAIIQAGKLLDIEVLDHVVIGSGRWVSLKERGLGFA